MIYLIYGSNQEILIEKEIKKIIKNCGDKIDELSQFVFDYSEMDVEEFLNECSTPSFFTEQKLVVVKNASCFQTSKKMDETGKTILEYIKNPSDFITLIFTVVGNIDEKREITKLLKDHAQFIKINSVDDNQWGAVIDQLIYKMNLEFDDEAKEEFGNRTAGDLAKINSELKKLQMYGERITLEVVKKLVPAKLEDNIFDMVEYILKNNTKASIKLFNDLKLMGEEPVRLVAALSSQFRFLYEVGYLASTGMNNDEIAKQFSNVKPGRIYYSLKKIGYRDLNDLLLILDELADLDYKLKNSEVDRFRAFELFLIKER